MHRRTLIVFTLVNVAACSLLLTAGVPLPPVRLPSAAAPGVSRARILQPSPALASTTLTTQVLDDLRSHDTAVRAAAARLAGEHGVREALPALRQLTQSSDPDVSIAGALAVARLERRPAALLDHVATGAVPAAAAAALLDCPDESAVEALAHLAAPADPTVRGVALRALARRAPDVAVPLIASGLRDSEDSLRFQALEASLDAPDAEYEPALRALSVSFDPLERRLALAGLASLGDGAAAESLRSMLRDVEAADAVQIAESMVRAGVQGGAQAWSVNLDRLKSMDQADTILRMRADAPADLAPVLRERLRSPSRAVRIAAAVVLAEDGEAAAGDVLQADAVGCGDVAVEAEARVLLALLDRR